MCIHLKTPSKCYHDWTIADHSFKKYKIWSSYIESLKTTVFISTMKNHGSFLITIVTEMNAFAIQDICNCWVWLIPQSISNCNFWVWLLPEVCHIAMVEFDCSPKVWHIVIVEFD